MENITPLFCSNTSCGRNSNFEPSLGREANKSNGFLGLAVLINPELAHKMAVYIATSKTRGQTGQDIIINLIARKNNIIDDYIGAISRRRAPDPTTGKAIHSTGCLRPLEVRVEDCGVH
jgi:hypothetical protein